MSIFSESLKELREQKKISMRALAEKIQVSDAAICKWENGENEPKASNLKMLCEFFEVSSDYLLGLENESGNKCFSSPQKIGEILSPDEKEILSTYRKLPYTWKMRVRAYADVSLEMSKEEQQRKNG